MKKAFLIKLLSLIFVLCSATCIFTACKDDGDSADENSECVHSWQEADCLTPKTCLECGAVEGEPLGHDFIDNACKNCGLQATPAGYFNFELLEDGTYAITAKDVNNMPAEVVIPSSYNGNSSFCVLWLQKFNLYRNSRQRNLNW